MVRMADILKRLGGYKPEETSPPKKPTVEEPKPMVEEPKPTVEEPKPKEEEKVQKERMEISQAMADKEKLSSSPEEPSQIHIAKAMEEIRIDKEKARALYQEMINLIKYILEKTKKDEPLDIKEVYRLIDQIVDQLVLGNEEFFALIETDSPENYLHTHCPNVAILAIGIALGFGYNKSKLIEVGIITFLHDVGMVKVMDIASQPRILSNTEYDQIKKHPKLGTEILKTNCVDETLIRAVKDIHERLNGSGYPAGISNGEIDECARIIGLADAYEAMTHERPYRKKYSPYNAFKEILSSANDLFEPSLIKILVNNIGIYPVGSWVELNTDEIAKVIETNKESPLRPVVNIMFDSHHNILKDASTVDLAKYQSRYIKRPLSDEEVKEIKPKT